MSRHGPWELFDSFVASVLPFGGGVVAIANLYFDESGTHQGARVMTMAGYWFDPVQAVRFGRDWAKDLAKLGLSHAHMTDCALGFGEYKGLSMADRVRSETLLIEHIKRRSRFGFALCVNPAQYDEIMADIPGAPSCYSLCLMICVNKVTEYAKEIGFDGHLAYFFEAGHAKATEANRYMNVIPKHGIEAMEQYRYAGHAFVDKRIALPLQAADMLAWQVRHYYERAIDGHFQARKDFAALVRPRDFHSLASKQQMLALREVYIHVTPLIEAGKFDEVRRKEEEIVAAFGLQERPDWLPKHPWRR